MTEAVPGYQLDPNNPPSAAGMPGNIMIFDQRYGDARMAVNPTGYTSGLVSTPNGWVYDYYAKQTPMAILTPLLILQNSWDGGNNGQNSQLGYFDKTTYAPMSVTNYSHTPGQHITLGAEHELNFDRRFAGTGELCLLLGRIQCARRMKVARRKTTRFFRATLNMAACWAGRRPRAVRR